MNYIHLLPSYDLQRILKSSPRFITIMPLKIIADYREILIDILFAIIIVVGFDRFFREFLPENIEELSSMPIMMDIFFFFAVYFWVISHWVSYHELITKYPYYRWRKFFVDIILFSIMFIIINVSFLAHQYEFSLLLVLLLAIWHLFACVWHLSDRGLRPLKLYLKLHSWRIITYVALLLFLYYPLGISFPVFELFAPEITDMVSLPEVNAIFSSLYQYGVMVTVILAIIFWNVHRLWRFTRRDSRYYLCKYIRGYPGDIRGYTGGDTSNEGRLELVRNPIKEKLGDKGEDIIKFESHNLPPIEIFAKDINNVMVKPDQSGKTDLYLHIYCKFSDIDGTIEDLKILFDLNDEIIASVGEGIKQLSERNRHSNSLPL